LGIPYGCDWFMGTLTLDSNDEIACAARLHEEIVMRHKGKTFEEWREQYEQAQLRYRALAPGNRKAEAQSLLVALRGMYQLTVNEKTVQ
jgi:hypothetical protein